MNKIEDLYKLKGKLLTQFEITQAQIRNVNIEIAALLNQQNRNQEIINDIMKKKGDKNESV